MPTGTRAEEHHCHGNVFCKGEGRRLRLGKFRGLDDSHWFESLEKETTVPSAILSMMLPSHLCTTGHANLLESYILLFVGRVVGRLCAHCDVKEHTG